MLMCIYLFNFVQIFDEILVNAADNRHRDKKMTFIDITVGPETTTLPNGTKEHGVKISVCNNGEGIPLTLHPKENIHIPELIFGHLLTGSNFSEIEDSITGGRHGYGAKLTNIFSHYFQVEVYDASSKQLYVQKWDRNMHTVHPPVITTQPLGENSDYTKITFVPDLGKFHMSSGTAEKDPKTLLKTSMALLHRRALDIAACVGPVVTTFNGKVLFPVVGKGPKSASSAVSPSFDSYVRMFLPPDSVVEAAESVEGVTDGVAASGPTILHTRVNPRWELAIVSPSPTKSFDQMSFVNGVCTNNGGTHVNYISDQITSSILNEVRKRLGATKASTSGLIGPQMIRNKFMLFVNCNISNPSFDSQSKDTLTTGVDSFGSTCELSGRLGFMKKLLKSSIVDDLVADIRLKEEMKLAKAVKTTKKTASSSFSKLHLEVPKLDDARFAGNSVDSKSLQCKLILTEGDSAKALAVAGLEVVGREYYGVMPLRGKILNVRDVSAEKLRSNEDIISLCKVIGLDFRKTYKEGLANQGLRYGSIVLMTDQDPDGSHIKGLIINLFHHFWPHLLQIEGFLQHFITPLVKVKVRDQTSKSSSANSKSSKTNSKIVQTKVFYSIPEYLKWCAATDMQVPGGASDSLDPNTADSVGSAAGMSGGRDIVSVKYYKGLGTNTAEEGKEYFRNMPMHMKLFGNGSNSKASDPASGSDTDQNDSSMDNIIDLAFRKSRTADRKVWLRTVYDPASFVDPSEPVTSYKDFVNKELIHFSHADNIRSIPSCIDGMKPAQRKVLYACFKKKLMGSAEMKVAQLTGYVAEQTAYHHGEMSLNQTIVRMAQDYVGSNNLPLLQPCGQFGTRNQGGHDHASARYIFTQLSTYARLIFPEADDSLLKRHLEDDMVVEPETYVPIIPLLLVNGSEGIGTGWSTDVPPHNPIEIIDVLEQMIAERKRKKKGSLECQDFTSACHAKQLVPWVRSFKGSITPVATTLTKFSTEGVWNIVNKGSKSFVDVTELPPFIWTDSYKEMLIKSINAGGSTTAAVVADPDALKIKGFVENHKTNSVNFQIELSRKIGGATKASGSSREEDMKMLKKLLKLESSICTSKFVACALCMCRWCLQCVGLIGAYLLFVTARVFVRS